MITQSMKIKKDEYDRMNYQTSQLKRSWIILVQASEPSQVYKMCVLAKIVNSLELMLSLV